MVNNDDNNTDFGASPSRACSKWCNFYFSRVRRYVPEKEGKNDAIISPTELTCECDTESDIPGWCVVSRESRIRFSRGSLTCPLGDMI